MEHIKDIHALAGIIVFVVGLLQIILKKGGKLHRYLGLTYVLTWVVLLVTGAMIGSYLITLLGVFGFYYVLTGYRFAKLKKVPARVFDKALIIMGLGVGIWILISGVRLFLAGNTGMAIVFGVFGGIFTAATFQDYLQFIRNRKIDKLFGVKQFWYFEHFGRMYISFIAATTAFSAIQQITGITAVDWLLPTVFGTLLIAFTKRHYIRKFNIKV